MRPVGDKPIGNIQLQSCRGEEVNACTGCKYCFGEAETKLCSLHWWVISTGYEECEDRVGRML